MPSNAPQFHAEAFSPAIKPRPQFLARHAETCFAHSQSPSRPPLRRCRSRRPISALIDAVIQLSPPLFRRFDSIYFMPHASTLADAMPMPPPFNSFLPPLCSRAIRRCQPLVMRTSHLFRLYDAAAIAPARHRQGGAICASPRSPAVPACAPSPRWLLAPQMRRCAAAVILGHYRAHFPLSAGAPPGNLMMHDAPRHFIRFHAQPSHGCSLDHASRRASRSA